MSSTLLSKTQTTVLRLAADGLTNREIGRQIYMAEDTVKTHMRRVMAKLRTPNRTASVATALRQGWIE